MRPWTAFFVMLPVGMATWFVWAIAADQHVSALALLGVASALFASWLLARSAAGTAAPGTMANGFEAPPGSGAPSNVPAYALVPGRIAHFLLAWAWANFLGIDLILFDGDVTAAGLTWFAMVFVTVLHAAQAMWIRPVAERMV